MNKRQTKHVKVLARLATLLMVLVWTPVSVAGTDTSIPPAKPTTTAFESPAGSPPAEEPSLISRVTAQTKSNEGFSDTLQTLSPGPFLALGILGLFWIRSHMVEL